MWKDLEAEIIRIEVLESKGNHAKKEEILNQLGLGFVVLFLLVISFADLA